MKTIDSAQLNELIHGDADVTVIDVLPEDEYRQEHVPAAVNVPVALDDFEQRVEKITPDKSSPVVVYCANTDCDLSPKAAQRLENAGFANVLDFQGGIQEWRESNQPVEASA